jgi:hypothetical protein
VKRTIAVPSFISDSPTIKIVNLGLAPALFSKATTATGSVAAKIDPKTIHRFQFQSTGITWYINNPMIKAPMITPGPASNND